MNNDESSLSKMANVVEENYSEIIEQQKNLRRQVFIKTNHQDSKLCNFNAEDYGRKELTMGGSGGGGMEYENDGMDQLMMSAGTICCLLGVASVLLNSFVIATLFRHRQKVRNNVFYLIALHCGIVDFIRGLCLILWCIPFIIDNYVDFRTRIRHTRMKQQVSVFLKTTNLLTVFNLLLFTINEFIVIKKPIRYRHIFRRRVVKILLISSWVVSLSFCLTINFVRNLRGNHGIMVQSNTTFLGEKGIMVTRHARADEYLPLHYAFIFTIMSLCYLCIITVVICYGGILRTIHRFRATEEGGLISGSTFQRVSGPNISRKMSANSQVTLSTQTSNGLGAAGAASALMMGTGDGGGKNWINGVGGHSSSTGGIRNGSGQSSSRSSHQMPLVVRSQCRRRIRQYLLHRHKYIIVIGMVLFVNILYLLPYSIIQILSFLHIRQAFDPQQNDTLMARTASIRWLLQILIGLHAVCQPICYFRMTEFRRFICGTGSHFVHRSKASSSNNLIAEDRGLTTTGSAPGASAGAGAGCQQLDTTRLPLMMNEMRTAAGGLPDGSGLTAGNSNINRNGCINDNQMTTMGLMHNQKWGPPKQQRSLDSNKSASGIISDGVGGNLRHKKISAPSLSMYNIRIEAAVAAAAAAEAGSSSSPKRHHDRLMSSSSSSPPGSSAVILEAAQSDNISTPVTSGC